MNVRGFVCNWQNVRSFDWTQYDILAFNEVWSIKDYENLIVDGYEVKAVKLRQATRDGGTIIFGRKDREVVAIDSPFIEGCLETTSKRFGKVVFVNVYRPPSGNKDLFVESLTRFLNTLRFNNIILGGDFNLNMLVDNHWINSICNLFNLEKKIAEVTRVGA